MITRDRPNLKEHVISRITREPEKSLQQCIKVEYQGKRDRVIKTKRPKIHSQLISVNHIETIKEIEQNPPKITGFTISRIEYLIHLILSHKQDKHAGAWSVLNMELMTNVIPQANDYLNLLRDKKIIERKNYFAKEHSYLYRLINEGKTEYRTITDQRLIYRIEKNRRNKAFRNSKKYPVLNEYIHKVDVDYLSALTTIESEYRKNIISTDKEKGERAEGRRTFSLAEVNKIHSGQIYITVNDTNKRLDSNYTRLPSELVKHLTIDRKPLTEIDIKNSQPFFSACLFNPTPKILFVMNRILGRSLTMSVKSLNISECKDVKLYKSLVTSGDLYFYLMDKFIENGIDYNDKADFKEQLFTIYFGENKSKRFSKAVRLFASEFPNVQRLFEVIKEKEYEKLSVLLQNIESFVILENVTQRIITELPGIPFLTKHDSLLPAGILTSDYSDKVREIMITTIKEVTGLTPQVRIKK